MQWVPTLATSAGIRTVKSSTTRMNFNELFQDLEARLTKYNRGDLVNFFMAFSTPKERDAFEADPKFKTLFGSCSREKTVSIVGEKPALKWAITKL
jgi:hypothetical protein